MGSLDIFLDVFHSSAYYVLGAVVWAGNAFNEKMQGSNSPILGGRLEIHM